MSNHQSPSEARYGAQAPEHGRAKAAQRPRRGVDTYGWRVGGLVAALVGSITRPGEMRSSDDGNPRLLFSTVVDGDRLADEAAPPVRVEYLGDDAEALVPRLLKNTEIYVEGSLRLNTWAGRDGVERTGLYVKATHIEVLGQIGA